LCKADRLLRSETVFYPCNLLPVQRRYIIHFIEKLDGSKIARYGSRRKPLTLSMDKKIADPSLDHVDITIKE